MNRHWEAVYAYASLCTSSTCDAGILAGVAFMRKFGSANRGSGPLYAWRPALLNSVMRIALEWDATGRAQSLHPGLRAGGGDPHPAPGTHPPDNRRLINRAFHQLPELAQCLLWHTLVEGEDISGPAALVGLDTERAGHELDRALTLLRASCVQAHLTLAVDEQCRRYNRLIEVVTRASHLDHLPDLRRHSRQCSHCRHALDQLDHSPRQLPLLLAEAVLDWRADDYLAARHNGTSEAVQPPGRRPFTGGPTKRKRDARLNRSMAWAAATVIILAAAGTTIVASLTSGTAIRAAQRDPDSAAPSTASPDEPSGVQRRQPKTAPPEPTQRPSTAPSSNTTVPEDAAAPSVTCRSGNEPEPEATTRCRTVVQRHDEHDGPRHGDLNDDDRDRPDAHRRHEPDRCEPRPNDDWRHGQDPCDRRPDGDGRQGPHEYDGRERDRGGRQGPHEYDGRERDRDRDQHTDQRQWSGPLHQSASPPHANGAPPARDGEWAR
jgi:hypothetical protein